MKKLLPLLLVSVLVFSGLQAVATADDEVEAVVKGGFGVTVTITNNGETPIEESGEVTILFLRMVSRFERFPRLSIPTPIPADGGIVSVKTKYLFPFGAFGIGPMLVQIDIDGDGENDAQAKKIAVVLGPFVLMSDLSVSIP